MKEHFFHFYVLYKGEKKRSDFAAFKICHMCLFSLDFIEVESIMIYVNGINPVLQWGNS